MLGMTNHSKVPLRLATMLGFALAIVNLLIGAAYFLYKLLFWSSFTVGVAPIVIGLFFFAPVQLFFMGIVGEYVAPPTPRLTGRWSSKRSGSIFPPPPMRPPNRRWLRRSITV